jgi:hypothetical protein
MHPHNCDQDCFTYRRILYGGYIFLFVGIAALALCHFIVTLIRRRRAKEEARDHYIYHDQIIAATTSSTFTNPTFSNDQDEDIRITTDGANSLVIEIPEDSQPKERGRALHPTTHRHRPLTTTQEEETLQDLDKILGRVENNEEDLSKKNMVKVDVHSNNRRNSNMSNMSTYSRSLFSGVQNVAVATVSAVVSQQQKNNPNSMPVPLSDLGHISRPHSAIDISDLVASPEPSRKESPKSKTS